MKVDVYKVPPAPVVEVVERVTITLTPEEAQLFAKAEWFGPKGHADYYFRNVKTEGTIGAMLDTVEDGVVLRDLLRQLKDRIQEAV